MPTPEEIAEGVKMFQAELNRDAPKLAEILGVGEPLVTLPEGFTFGLDYEERARKLHLVDATSITGECGAELFAANVVTTGGVARTSVCPDCLNVWPGLKHGPSGEAGVAACGAEAVWIHGESEVNCEACLATPPAYRLIQNITRAITELGYASFDEAVREHEISRWESEGYGPAEIMAWEHARGSQIVRVHGIYYSRPACEADGEYEPWRQSPSDWAERVTGQKVWAALVDDRRPVWAREAVAANALTHSRAVGGLRAAGDMAEIANNLDGAAEATIEDMAEEIAEIRRHRNTLFTRCLELEAALTSWVCKCPLYPEAASRTCYLHAEDYRAEVDLACGNLLAGVRLARTFKLLNGGPTSEAPAVPAVTLRGDKAMALLVVLDYCKAILEGAGDAEREEQVRAAWARVNEAVS